MGMRQHSHVSFTSCLMSHGSCETFLKSLAIPVSVRNAMPQLASHGRHLEMSIYNSITQYETTQGHDNSHVPALDLEQYTAEDWSNGVEEYGKCSVEAMCAELGINVVDGHPDFVGLQRWIDVSGRLDAWTDEAGFNRVYGKANIAPPLYPGLSGAPEIFREIHITE